MNNYQLSDEVGKGSLGIVYKGRKRSTLDYFAISSLDKCSRRRLLNSVAHLRALNHPSVVGFHNWYETGHHMWLISELCVGGDLRTILATEKRLKKATVRAYGADVAEGLLFMHMNGILLNNISPGKLLLDDTVSLRFYDFGVACSFENTAAQKLSGVPLYMAPELFVPEVGGVLSVATDLWAFGCLLFEMTCGTTPFTGATVSAFLDSLLRGPPAPINDVSEALADLIAKLLVKDPLQRATWEDVITSTFWEGRLATVAEGQQQAHRCLPAQPAFERYQQERAGRRGWATEGEIADSIRAMVARARTPAPGEGGSINDEDMPHEVQLSREVDFSPLKLTEQQELQLLNSVGSSTAVPALEGAGAAAAAASASKAAGATTTGRNNSADTRRNASNVRSAGPPSVTPVLTGAKGGGRAATGTLRPHNSNGVVANTVVGRTGLTEDVMVPLAGPRKSFGARAAPDTNAVAPASSKLKSGKGTGALTGSMSLDQRLTKAQVDEYAGDLIGKLDLVPELFLPSDGCVRPLVMNPRIERYALPTYDRESLGVRVYALQELKTIMESRTDVTPYITSIYRRLAPSVPDEERLNILHYLETICPDVTIANTIVNSSIMTLCIRLCQQRETRAALRCSAAIIMGLLVRHATFILIDLANSGIFPQLLQLVMSETNIRVRRKLFACVGELLFYIVMQTGSNQTAWRVSPMDVRRVYIGALDSDDEIMRHYAVKAIENMCSVPGAHFIAAAFACEEVLNRLLAVYAMSFQSAVSEHIKTTALCAAMKVSMLADSLLPRMVDSSEAPLSAFPSIMSSTTQSRVPQLMLSFVCFCFLKCMQATQHPCMALWTPVKKSVPEVSPPRVLPAGMAVVLGPTTLSRTEGTFMFQELDAIIEELIEGLCNNCDKLPSSTRGKVLTLVALVVCVGNSTFARVCSSSRNVIFLDRLLMDSDAYVQRCGTVFCATIGAFIADKLGEVRKRVSSSTTPLNLAAIQELLDSSTVQKLTRLQPSVFTSLEECVDKSLSNSMYGAYENEFMTLIERIVQNPSTVATYWEPICLYLTRPFFDMLRRKDEARRFAALRFFTSLVASFVNSTGLGPSGATAVKPRTVDKFREDITSTCTRVADTVAAVLPSLLGSMNPTPSRTLCLLVACGRCSTDTLTHACTDEVLSAVIAYISNTPQADLLSAFTLLFTCIANASAHQQKQYLSCYTAEHVPSLLVRTLSASLKNNQDDLSECCCEFAAFILEKAFADSKSCAAQQCEELLQHDALDTVFLPLAGGDGGSTAALFAAKVVTALVPCSTEAQKVMLTMRGADTVRRALMMPHTDSENVETVRYMLKAMQSALELQQGGPDKRTIAADGRFTSVLKEASAATSVWPRAVQVAAAKIVNSLGI